MSQSEIAQQKKIVLSTLTAIQQYPDYISPTGDDEFDLENTIMEALIDYLKNDMDNLKDLVRPTSSEDLEEVLTKEKLDDITIF